MNDDNFEKIIRKIRNKEVHMTEKEIEDLYDVFFEFSIFATKFEQAKLENPKCKEGQTYFNVLRQVNPKLANEIRSTPYDPFHCETIDKKINAYVIENWRK